MNASDTLERLRVEGEARLNPETARITIGMGTCGLAAGAREVHDALEGALCAAQSETLLVSVGCRGLCYAEPLVELAFPTGERALFGNVDASKAEELVRAAEAGTIAGVSDELRALLVDDSFVAGQERRVLANCGIVDPRSLAEYVACGGYDALRKVLAMQPREVIDEVVDANVRGRGGAGFPAGLKWRACADNEAPERYFIVNGDEGDPGAYMDRGLLESDPHRVLEGLIIACYAIGVHQAYFFIRAEYPLAVRTVQAALDDARAAGLLGDDILGSGFDLEVSIVRGAGAFLCGESTAMVNVLENGECTTRHKPPHLTERGLWGAPTCINNVETLANVPLVMLRGAQWFRSVGTMDSPGTKIFSVTGSVERSGLVEVALGTTLGVVVNDIACAKDPKAVQIGGPSGAILPAALADLPVSFEGLAGVDGMMGSGGFVVISASQCVVDTASYLVHFSAGQSCRKCKPCRDGLDECALIYERITAGQGTPADLERLQEVAERNCSSKLCGLGRTSLSPVLSSLHYFRDEYEAHLGGCCPGLVCRNLISYVIDETKCQGERCCLLTCPGNAVKGRFGKAGHIVGRLCQKCGMCMVTCPYGAVRKVSPAVR